MAWAKAALAEVTPSPTAPKSFRLKVWSGMTGWSGTKWVRSADCAWAETRAAAAQRASRRGCMGRELFPHEVLRRVGDLDAVARLRLDVHVVQGDALGVP